MAAQQIMFHKHAVSDNRVGQGTHVFDHFGEKRMLFLLVVMNVGIITDKVDNIREIFRINGGSVQDGTAHILNNAKHAGNIGMLFDHYIGGVHGGTPF